ncbi:toll/interleukin-1 receptor domain-containing protein [Paenibacillus xylanexedens]|uniref:toll/interleukin-1 receptor domain-containing protein n=1 Tax=Paenibacillus xylanexedens TaxID=528191 RepID=UPI003D0375B6
MIFISHNWNDKPLIEPIAIKLAEVFGRDKVFYDSWSIQPGDGIIDKMNTGLTECRFFLFFVSKNSLNSKMVQLEWQTMLMQSSQNQSIKFIPIKVDDSMMPIILLQTLYIDVFGKGVDFAVRQMVDVINGNNTFNKGVQKYENVRGEVSIINQHEVKIIVRAISYAEPISRYAILVDNNNEITYSVRGEQMMVAGFNETVQINEKLVSNVIYIELQRSTTPSFPLEIELKHSKQEINVRGIMRSSAQDQWDFIPVSLSK